LNVFLLASGTGHHHRAKRVAKRGPCARSGRQNIKLITPFHSCAGARALCKRKRTTRLAGWAIEVVRYARRKPALGRWHSRTGSRGQPAVPQPLAHDTPSIPPNSHHHLRCKGQTAVARSLAPAGCICGRGGGPWPGEARALLGLMSASNRLASAGPARIGRSNTGGFHRTQMRTPRAARARSPTCR